jgi:hypothetical protein
LDATKSKIEIPKLSDFPFMENLNLARVGGFHLQGTEG